MSDVKTRNMKIKGTSLTMADHGVLTFYLELEGDVSAVDFGGWNIGRGYLGADEERFEGYPKGLKCLMRIMDTVGVSRWEDLPGKYVRIVEPGVGGVVRTIGNIVKDKWFDLPTFFSD